MKAFISQTAEKFSNYLKLYKLLVSWLHSKMPRNYSYKAIESLNLVTKIIAG